MGIIDRHEHEQCHHQNKQERPLIELVRIAKGNRGNLHIHNNEIIFFMEGRLRFMFSDFPNYEGMKGHILFLPAGKGYSFEALQASEVMVFRILDPIHLCDNLSLEKLHANKKNSKESYKSGTHTPNILEINTRIWHLLDGISGSLTDGVRCRRYFDLKIKEFFMLLRMYYSKEDIYDFFCLILSGDIAFSEYIRLYWHKFRNVEEIAESMHLTARQFSAKFKEVFGQTAYKWMKEGRAKLVRQQLLATKKPVKQIAYENGFSNLSQFTKFCKKEIGHTPTKIRSTNHHKM